MQNVINQVLTTTARELLPPNPRRKAFVIAPLANNSDTLAIVAEVFNGFEIAQTWTVPAGVTSMLDAFVWGAGGAGAPDQGATGGGGGGSGGFATAGQQTLVPGSVWTVNADDSAHNIGFSSLLDPSAVLVAKANSGADATTVVGGAGGTAPTGVVKFGGTVGQTIAANDGGGGSGGSGYGSGGNPGFGGIGGTGGGTATYLGYGVGGNGGNGGVAPGDGTAGIAPGGSGGGASNGGQPGNGADGLVVIFYEMTAAQAALSMSPRADVVPGQGTLNWLPGASFPICLTDDQIGDIIGQPWFAISGVDGVAVQVTEYLYQSEQDYVRAFK